MVSIDDMGPNDRIGGTFYVYDALDDRPFTVRVCGYIRTDYIQIRDGYGRRGVFFPSMSREEICNVSISYE